MRSNSRTKMVNLNGSNPRVYDNAELILGLKRQNEKLKKKAEDRKVSLKLLFNILTVKEREAEKYKNVIETSKLAFSESFEQAKKFQRTVFKGHAQKVLKLEKKLEALKSNFKLLHSKHLQMKEQHQPQYKISDSNQVMSATLDKIELSEKNMTLQKENERLNYTLDQLELQLEELQLELDQERQKYSADEQLRKDYRALQNENNSLKKKILETQLSQESLQGQLDTLKQIHDSSVQSTEKNYMDLLNNKEKEFEQLKKSIQDSHITSLANLKSNYETNYQHIEEELRSAKLKLESELKLKKEHYVESVKLLEAQQEVEVSKKNIGILKKQVEQLKNSYDEKLNQERESCQVDIEESHKKLDQLRAQIKLVQNEKYELESVLSQE